MLIEVTEEQRQALVKHGNEVLSQVINFRLRKVKDRPALSLNALKRASRDLRRDEGLMAKGRESIIHALDAHINNTFSSVDRRLAAGTKTTWSPWCRPAVKGTTSPPAVKVLAAMRR